MSKKTKSPIKLFIAVFAVTVAIMVISTITREKVALLAVPDNAGVSILKTINNSLVCVFQDGRVVSWNWGELPEKTGDFKAASDQAIILDAGRMAAVNKEGKKVLTFYNLPTGQKQESIPVGWEDQYLWLRVSPDKKTIALIRGNIPDAKGGVLYDFLTLDMDTEMTASPVPVSIQQDTEDFLDYAVTNNSVLCAVGSQDDIGRIVIVDLNKGDVLWDKTFDNTKEFCSVAVSRDGAHIYAGNGDGFLYKIDADTGDLIRKIQLLEEGETRPVTNDYSVLNLAFSQDGQYFVVTINPKVYVLRVDSDAIIHAFFPADRLVSKITFSPDNQFIATSDIRAGKPVKVWEMPKKK